MSDVCEDLFHKVETLLKPEESLKLMNTGTLFGVELIDSDYFLLIAHCTLTTFLLVFCFCL